MEKEIIDLMKSNNLKKINLISLIDLGNALDADLEEYPIIADVIEIRDNNVYIYDSSNEDNNGDIEPIYKLSDLPKYIIDDVFCVLKDTLIIKTFQE